MRSSRLAASPAARNLTVLRRFHCLGFRALGLEPFRVYGRGCTRFGGLSCGGCRVSWFESERLSLGEGKYSRLRSCFMVWRHEDWLRDKIGDERSIPSLLLEVPEAFWIIAALVFFPKRGFCNKQPLFLERKYKLYRPCLVKQLSAITIALAVMLTCTTARFLSQRGHRIEGKRLRHFSCCHAVG